MHALANPLESTGEQTIHKSWRESWPPPHFLTQPSQLLNFSTAHTGALRLVLCCEFLNSSRPPLWERPEYIHPESHKVGRTGET